MTYVIKKVPMKEDIPIWIDPQGSKRTDVYTPKSYLNYKIEERMKRLDDLMVNYLTKYLNKRKALREEFHNVKSPKGQNVYEMMNEWTPEEREEYRVLYELGLKRLRGTLK